MWSKSFFVEFLEIYHKNECLWKVKSKDYYNKTKKKNGYAQLLAKARTVDPKFTEDDIKKKINNFRSSFRKEYKKVSTSMIFSADTSQLYVPKLWYYDQLLFLKDEEKEDQSEFDDDSEHNNSEPEYAEESFVSMPSSCATKRKKTLSPQTQELQEQIFVTQANNDTVHYEDNFDIIGKNIALKLRELRKDQSIIAEKLINDVMFEAQFNNLNKHAQIVIPSLHPDMLLVMDDELSS